MRRHTKRTDGPPSCCSLSQSKPRSKVVHCMSMDLQLWHTPQHCLVWVNLAWCCAELFKPADLLSMLMSHTRGLAHVAMWCTSSLTRN